ncbi:MAG TPA: bifunctional 4-hydroxy-2-oxoglutarate aldolase/2-dehydro-3-deoxy-phosphogluconate aldolase [Bacteroidales bacterium]|jgi:2-dehydro-3-deoxyphosphogluconate aldolase/(4S)-4-hydroxy-2-oxoglutarate aldolase|nr:bifunctional 4-hydroxy-2-oxoglutarate aldolase/2-dehydro-3-deoxy-phosphogluconate aldolase [Bacteroidales bacterium]
MARFTRLQVATAFLESGMIPVFYNKDTEICKKVIKACYEGGLRVFEFTNRGDFAHEVFRDLNKYVMAELPQVILGAGSVIDAGIASLYIQMGANFIVSPIINEETAKTCNRRKILWCPGCGSVSEISRAEELGAEIVKVFPGKQVGGPGFVEAVKGPMPWTNIMPTGGVEPTEESLGAWFKAGVACVGMGSQLISKSITDSGDYTSLTRTCRDAIEIIKKYRK